MENKGVCDKIVSRFVHILDIYLYLLLNWKSLKLACEVKGECDTIIDCILHYLHLCTPPTVCLCWIFPPKNVTH